MIIIDAWKRRQRIRELRKLILAASIEKYDDDPAVDSHLAHEATREGEYELDQLLQAPRIEAAERWGLDIPAEFWDRSDDEWVRGPTLSEKGRKWVAREAGRRRREVAKDWVAILSPVFSLAISLLGLLVALLTLKQRH